MGEKGGGTGRGVYGRGIALPPACQPARPLVEFCGLKGPGKLDGQSLAPLLRQPERSFGRLCVT